MKAKELGVTEQLNKILQVKLLSVKLHYQKISGARKLKFLTLNFEVARKYIY